MIDLHCHILPGLDDGPATMEDAVELGRRQAAAGVTTVVATPHVNYHWKGVTSQRIAEGVAELNDALAQADVGVRVVAGAEVALTRAVDLDDDELADLRLGDGPWLLLEPPFAAHCASTVVAASTSLLSRGHQLVIAHPERCDAFLADRTTLERLLGSGALCSITASALTGDFGRDAKRFALELLADGLVHDVASDAHGVDPRRPPGLTQHLQDAGYEALAGWMCDAVPRALLDGDPVPPRPRIAEPEPAEPSRGGGLARLFRRG